MMIFMSKIQRHQFEIDLALDVQQIRLHKQTLSRSKIDAYKNDIIVLRQLNVSFNDISIWLNEYHGVHVSPSTVNRRFHYWMTYDESRNQFRDVT